MEQLDAEVVETVAGVRAYFDTQLSWYGHKPSQSVRGHHINYSRWGSTPPRMRHWACYLVAPGWMGPTPVGQGRKRVAD
jgi:hypothetical protein